MRFLVFSSLFIFATNLLAIPYKWPAPMIKTRSFSPPIESYDELLRRIQKDRTSLKRTNQSLDSCRTYFLQTFEHDIFPHWVGTSWDYNGYANRPGEGKLIACGYFVSTPLKHMGFNWNRFKLAQMYSKGIVETICDDMTIYDDRDSMVKELESREDHLYIVGLDNHVGMLLKSRGKIWFVHSNYINIEGPVQEMAAYSEVLGYSANYWVGTFSTDVNMQKWLDGTVYPTE